MRKSRPVYQALRELAVAGAVRDVGANGEGLVIRCFGLAAAPPGHIAVDAYGADGERWQVKTRLVHRARLATSADGLHPGLFDVLAVVLLDVQTFAVDRAFLLPETAVGALLRGRRLRITRRLLQHADLDDWTARAKEAEEAWRL